MKTNILQSINSLLAIIVIVLCTSSCVATRTVGSYFNYDARTELNSGMSEQTVTNILEGKPDEKTNNDDGSYDLTWRYAKGNSLGKGEGYGLIIRFSSSGEMVKIVKEATRKLR